MEEEHSNPQNRRGRKGSGILVRIIRRGKSSPQWRFIFYILILSSIFLLSWYVFNISFSLPALIGGIIGLLIIYSIKNIRN
ncbi:MAG: hypothetical protein ACLFT7_08140 [Thermoplasmata archaeon]